MRHRDPYKLRDTFEACGALVSVEQLIDELTRAATTALDQTPIADDDVRAALH